ncbi:hypothetical protein F4780DRAFT_726546 [Xylariomycetidae sp. FL0641]|nr:hypothetical protein F4780DRAFT_726546 [Xylariomycetidae sp. FL0641]
MVGVWWTKGLMSLWASITEARVSGGEVEGSAIAQLQVGGDALETESRVSVGGLGSNTPKDPLVKSTIVVEDVVGCQR